MHSLEKIFNKLTKKELNYLLHDFNDNILSWYNGDLSPKDRKNFLKAITFIKKLFPTDNHSIKIAYRVFENKKELASNKKLSKSTKPCASFSKDIRGLFSFMKELDSDSKSYIVKVNVKKQDVLIDTNTLIKYIKGLISFFKVTKNSKVIEIIKNYCYDGGLVCARQDVCENFRNTIRRLKEFNHENEVVLRTDRHLSVEKLVDPIKLNDIIKDYLLK